MPKHLQINPSDSIKMGWYFVWQLFIIISLLKQARFSVMTETLNVDAIIRAIIGYEGNKGIQAIVCDLKMWAILGGVFVFCVHYLFYAELNNSFRKLWWCVLVSSSVKCCSSAGDRLDRLLHKAQSRGHILWRMAHKHTLYVHFEFLISNEKPLSNTSRAYAVILIGFTIAQLRAL